MVAPMLTAVVTADQRPYDGVGSARLLSTFIDNRKELVTEGQK